MFGLSPFAVKIFKMDCVSAKLSFFSLSAVINMVCAVAILVALIKFDRDADNLL